MDAAVYKRQAGSTEHQAPLLYGYFAVVHPVVADEPCLEASAIIDKVGKIWIGSE